MILQFFSDIHLEFGPMEMPETEADVIVAAGDIGIGADALPWLAAARKPVIYIAGNHEFYTKDMMRTVRTLAKKTKGTNIEFLNNTSTHIDGVRFLGSTLWTDFDHGNLKLMARASKSMNDYSQIRHGKAALKASQVLHAHLRSKKWLANEVNKPFNGKTVVVTHHAPTVKSWKESDPVEFKHSYCSDLTEMFDSSKIQLWIHGHIHRVSDYETNGVRVLCNPRGYCGHQRIRGFDAAKTIKI